MCQIKYNTNKKEKKYSHINYTERTQIERWWNVEHKSKVEIANLLNKSERTIRREIKKGLTENLTHDWKTIYVYSADIAQNKYEYNKTGKGPQLKLGNDYELKEYIEKGIKKDKKSPEILLAQIEEYDLKFKSKVCAKTIRNCIHKGGIFELTDKDMIYNKEYKEKNKEKAHCSRVPAEVEDLRGVKSERPIATLVSRALIQEVGRAEGTGRAILYGTTKEFLNYFGLKNINELPPLPEQVDEEDDQPTDLFLTKFQETFNQN